MRTERASPAIELAPPRLLFGVVRVPSLRSLGIPDGFARARGRIVGVARREEDLHLRPLRRERLGELAPAYARHDHVGEQEMDRGGELLGDEKRLAPFSDTRT